MKATSRITPALAAAIAVFAVLAVIHAEESKPAPAPPSSSWKGTWKADVDPEAHCGELECTAVQVEGNQWKAEFKGYCNRQFVYQVEMKGKQKGEKIVFKGEADLGGEDGTYTWTGKIAGDTFSGRYTSAKGKSGTFTMSPAAAAPAAPAP